SRARVFASMTPAKSETRPSGFGTWIFAAWGRAGSARRSGSRMPSNRVASAAPRAEPCQRRARVPRPCSGRSRIDRSHDRIELAHEGSDEAVERLTHGPWPRPGAHLE